MSIRYKLGPTIDFNFARPAPPVDESRDLVPTLEAVGVDTGAVLRFEPFDPTEKTPPVEARAYFVPSGEEVPPVADAFVASELPFSVDALEVPPGGHLHYLPIPAELQDGAYVVQIVLGYHTP